jgi:protein phosphatase
VAPFAGGTTPNITEWILAHISTTAKLLRSGVAWETLAGMTGPAALVAVALALAVLGVLFLSVGQNKTATRRRRAVGKGTTSRRPRSRRANGSGARGPTTEPQSAPRLDGSGALDLPKLRYEEDDAELTLVTLGAGAESTPSERDEHAAVPILYDEEAAIDEPTRASSLILVSAIGQTDRGRRRRRNEDSFLVLEEDSLYVIADGMGGHAGGDVASKLAVDTIETLFRSKQFPGLPHTTVPKRASELVLTIQAANAAIHDRACAEPPLEGMGTTLVSARFSPNKQRMYVGHVGDSRCYRLRRAELRQMTTDHTMEAEGYVGPHAGNLTRSVGIAPRLRVDLIIAKPLPDDIYLLCSDGLSKMLSNDQIRETLLSVREPRRAVSKLIDAANERGGRDNVTVIVIRAQGPTGGGRRIPRPTTGVVA